MITDNPISYILVFILLFVLILWAFSELHEIYNTWHFYKEQNNVSMANHWIITNIQRLVLFLSLFIFSLIGIFHWVTLPTYYALYGG